MTNIVQFPGKPRPALSSSTLTDGFVRMDELLTAVQYHMLVTKNTDVARCLMLLANNGVITGEFRAFVPADMMAFVKEADLEQMLKVLFSLSE